MKASRKPEPKVKANCDYCGSSDKSPASGKLCDEEIGENLSEAFRVLDFQYVKCSNCGLVYLPERPHPKDLPVFYPDEYKCYESYQKRGKIMKYLAAAVAQRKLELVEKLMPERTNLFLDYGCGSGTWMLEMKNLGCSLSFVGMDIMHRPLKELHKKGIPAYCSDEESIFEYIKPQSIGIIHLFHVIEHLPTPKKVLKELMKALVPGGFIIGQTPNVGSLGRRFWGDLWNQWHPPHHYVLFSEATLRRHCEQIGLEVLEIKNSMSGATQWSQSFLKSICKITGKPFRATRSPLYPPLIFAFLPWVMIEYFFSKTCHMDFILRRPAD